MHGFNMRHRSIESITKYAEIMVREGIRDIRFISPNSLAYLSSKPGRPNHEVLEELFTDLYERVVKKYGARIFFGTFPSEVRPDYVDEDVVSLLKRYVSNKTIIVGAQTGSNKLLNRIGRGHSIEDVFNAVKAIHKHGFTASIDFIIGLPSESDEDLKGSLNAIKKLVKMGAKIHLHTFIPLPGTPFAFEKPRKPPKWFIKEIAKIIGMGRAYGEWMHQARIAEKIIKLREKGLIMPRMMSSSSADH